MTYYVYRITNIKTRKYYYGSRGTKINPKKDIGYIYFSSSHDKEFIKDQKENPNNYRYKVINNFKTRKEALELEIKLHDKLNVGVHESFYNKAKQTSIGFTTSEKSSKKAANTLKLKGYSERSQKRNLTMIKNDTYKSNGLKISKSLSKKNKEGYSVADIRAIKSAKTMSNEICINGIKTTISKEIGKKASETKRGKGKVYSIYKNNIKIIEGVPAVIIRKISPNLVKENVKLAANNRSKSQFLNNNKGYLIDIYTKIEENKKYINNSYEEVVSLLKNTTTHLH